MDQRSYNQYCATARTLDIVGERWTLLMIRELLTGPKRFGDLQSSRPGRLRTSGPSRTSLCSRTRAATRARRRAPVQVWLLAT